MSEQKQDLKTMMDTMMMINSNSLTLDHVDSLSKKKESISSILNRYVGNRKIAAVCDMAVISDKMWYKMMANKVNPSKDLLLRLAFVLEIPANETQNLLKSGGCASLTISDEREICIVYGLQNKLSLGDIDEILLERGLQPLIPLEKKQA